MAGGLRQAWARSAPGPGATAGPPGLTPRDHRQIRKGRRRRAPKFPWSCHFLPPRLWVQRPERQRATTGVAGSVETCALRKGCSATAATPGTHARPRRARTGACGMPPCGREAPGPSGSVPVTGLCPAAPSPGLPSQHDGGGRGRLSAPTPRGWTVPRHSETQRRGRTGGLQPRRPHGAAASAHPAPRGPGGQERTRPPGSRRQHPRAALRLRCSAAPLPCRTGAGLSVLCDRDPAAAVPRVEPGWGPAGSRRGSACHRAPLPASRQCLPAAAPSLPLGA